MTVDIYIYAERQENGSWRSCYPIESFEQSETSYFDMRKVYENDAMGGDFELFRILLEAHRLQSHGANSVAQPRGLPHDLSPELREVVAWREGSGFECYYSSWMLLEEVLLLPWKGSDAGGVKDIGRIRLGASIASCFKSLLRQSFLAPFSNVAENDEMDHPVGDADLRSEAITKMVVAYSDAECCQTFVQHTVPLLKSFGQPDQVRIVFWG